MKNGFLLIAGLMLLSVGQAAQAGKLKVVCFGGSITNRGYYKVLEDLLDVEAINAGKGGHSSAMGFRRMQADVLAHKPDVVVVMFGTNDLRADSERVFVPVVKYKENLQSIIASCRKHGSKVVEWLSEDGVHPSDTGTKLIAEHIAKAVKRVIGSTQKTSTDVCVYGGTASGVVTAVQVARMGKSVVLIEPGKAIGGMTSGGLGNTDIGKQASIGGVTREFYQSIRNWYQEKENWKFQTKEESVIGPSRPKPRNAQTC